MQNALRCRARELEEYRKKSSDFGMLLGKVEGQSKAFHVDTSNYAGFEPRSCLNQHQAIR